MNALIASELRAISRSLDYGGTVEELLAARIAYLPDKAHRKAMRKAVKAARELRSASATMTFDPDGRVGHRLSMTAPPSLSWGEALRKVADELEGAA